MGQLSLFGGKRQRGIELPPPKEQVLHIAVAELLKMFCRQDWRFHHIPSGEHRDKRTAAKIKAMGGKRGWPDFQLLAPDGRAHFIELKRKLGGRDYGLSEEQVDFAAYANAHGYPHAVLDNIKSAIALLEHWGALRQHLEVSA